MKIASFFGHRDFMETNELCHSIKTEILNCIKNKGIDTFYLGGYGAFDYCCAKYISEIKRQYPYIKSFLVLPYIDKKFDEYKQKYINTTFDGTIYPPLENVPLRFAISKRNEWIIKHSDFIIFYINRTWGGANKFFEYAIKGKKDCINLGKIKIELKKWET